MIQKTFSQHMAQAKARSVDVYSPDRTSRPHAKYLKGLDFWRVSLCKFYLGRLNSDLDKYSRKVIKNIIVNVLNRNQNVILKM